MLDQLLDRLPRNSSSCIFYLSIKLEEYPKIRIKDPESNVEFIQDQQPNDAEEQQQRKAFGFDRITSYADLSAILLKTARRL